jgi:hypothetical protein
MKRNERLPCGAQYGTENPLKKKLHSPKNDELIVRQFVRDDKNLDILSAPNRV